MNALSSNLVIRLHEAIVPPDLAGVAMSVLQADTKDFFLGGPNGVQSIPMTHRFYQCDDEGFLMTAAGLVPRVVDACRQRGIAVSIIDRTRWPVLEQAAANLPDDFSETDSELLQAIIASPRGQIVAYARDHFDQAALISRVFAAARVLVVTANRKQRDRLLAKLKSKLNRPVSAHDKIAWGAPNRVTAMTSQFFAGIGRVNNDFDVIVFLGPDTVTGDQAYSTAVQLNHELMYCLVPPSYRPDELAQLRLEAICGPVIYSNIAPPSVVHVAMLGVPSIPVRAKMAALERKRTTIWRNDERNDLIADIALAMANGHLATFSRRSEFLPEHIDLLSEISNPGIAILVESIAHGRELQRRLPDWSVLTAIPNQDGTLDSGSCHQSVITESFASQGLHADILVRVTGTASPLMVRGFPAIGQRRASLLVDMADDFDEQARRNTGERVGDYQSRGWIVNAGNKVPGRRRRVSDALE